MVCAESIHALAQLLRVIQDWPDEAFDAALKHCPRAKVTAAPISTQIPRMPTATVCINGIALQQVLVRCSRQGLRGGRQIQHSSLHRRALPERRAWLNVPTQFLWVCGTDTAGADAYHPQGCLNCGWQSPQRCRPVVQHRRSVPALASGAAVQQDALPHAIVCRLHPSRDQRSAPPT